MASGDVREWSVISDEYCEFYEFYEFCAFCAFCAFCVMAAAVGGLYQGGGGITGRLLTLESDPAVTINDASGAHTVAFDYTTTASVAKDALTKMSVTSPAQVGTLVMDLEFTGNGWTLIELRLATA